MKTKYAVNKLLQKITGNKNITYSKDFYEIGGNSLLAAQLLFEIRNLFKVELAFQDLLVRPLSVNYLFSLLSQKENNSKNIKLDPAIKDDIETYVAPAIASSRDHSASPVKNVFLTGATGFIGAHLLVEILEKTDCVVHCLVRAKSNKEALTKIKNTLSAYKLNLKNDFKRIRPLIGDLGKRKMGLSQTKLTFLAKITDVVVHAGARVNFELSYDQLRGENVLGTREIMNFCAIGKHKSLHYISSLAVLGIDHYTKSQKKRKYLEKELTKIPITSGYAQTKFVAERNIRNATLHGLNANIYRLGEVAPSSKTGIPNTKSLYHIFIEALTELRMYPGTNTKFDYIPVDFVSNLIAKIMFTKKEEIKEIYHIAHPHGISLNKLISIINNEDLKIKKVKSLHFNLYLEKISETKMSSAVSTLALLVNEAYKVRKSRNFNIFESTFLKEIKDISFVNTNMALRKLGDSFPTLNNKALKPYVGFLKLTST